MLKIRLMLIRYIGMIDKLPDNYPKDMDPYLRKLLLYCFSQHQPNDFPHPSPKEEIQYDILIDIQLYNLISALARDIGKDFAEIFAEGMKFFAQFLCKFGGKQYN